MTNRRSHTLFYCIRCGWGICSLIDDAYYNKPGIEEWLKLKKAFRLCPYCKVSVSRIGTSDSSNYWGETRGIKIKEPVRLRYPVPKKIRAIVMERDGCQCVFCGSKYDLQIDHIIPVAEGGTNDIENLRVLCKWCNARRVMIEDRPLLRELKTKMWS